MLERFFKLSERNTNLHTEVLAGLTTFVTMAYIIFVNPSILSAAGMPLGPTIAATCIGAAVPTIAMGLFTNYPFALAAGMGINSAIVGFALSRGLSWHEAMGIIILEGLLVAFLVVVGLRQAVMRAIPLNLKRAIGAGIGLFIAFIGMQSAGWVVHPDKGTMLSFGSLRDTATLISTAGVVITAALVAWRVKGSLLLGIIGTTILALIFGKAQLPHSVLAVPSFSNFGQANVLGVLKVEFIAVVFSFLMIDFFDTMGTVIGIGDQAGFVDSRGRMPRVGRVLLVDSFAAIWGGIAGASSSTTYIESAAGVGEGGRSGLTSVVVGILFLLALFFSPVIGIVPAIATAPVLIIVGFMMLPVLKDFDFLDMEEAFPAFLILLVTPLTMSISHGIGYGFIAYTLIKLFRGKIKHVHPLMIIVSLVFAISFAAEAL